MYAIIDVETTGGSPSLDRVIEIAIVVFDGTQITDSFSTLVNPKRPIDPYVTKLTGITEEMVQGAPLFEEIHEKLLQLTHENIFVAHNVKFDFGMIRQEFKRLGIDFNRKQLPERFCRALIHTAWATFVIAWALRSRTGTAPREMPRQR